jgi:hypothetical protein
VEKCDDLDQGYNGTWYCQKAELCEKFIGTTGRSCVVTKGCATDAECYNYNTGNYWDGEKIETTSGIALAGTTARLWCCKAVFFPTDDTVARVYANVCNGASGGHNSWGVVAAAGMAVAAMAFLLMAA